VILFVAGMYLLNNTAVGLSIKCGVFGDIGACLMESLMDTSPLQEILENVGSQI
jgi:hypothetical protein